jgi:hypothetical protein
MIEDTMDNYYRDEVMDSLDEGDFTDDEIHEIREMWGNVDDEGGIDNEIYTNFVNEIVNSIMEKYKTS